jgi:hypothetical protein
MLRKLTNDTSCMHSSVGVGLAVLYCTLQKHKQVSLNLYLKHAKYQLLQIILYPHNFKREDTFCGNNFKRTRKETFPVLSKVRVYPDMFINEVKGRRI